jgi:DNA polymerase-1
MRPLLVVDGDNLAHRAYHSTPKTVQHNAVAGFFSMLFRIYQEEQPRSAFIAWDTLGVKTYRDELWPPYQGGRVFDQSIKDQLGLLPEVCRAFGFGVGKQAGYEADDLIASSVCADSGSCLVLTTDRDAYQLVSDRVTVLAPRRGTRELDRIGPHEVVERLGILPEQVPDYKALAGDSSDKIPGIRGIGPKAAASLLLRHGCLEAVVADWSASDAELAMRFREVVQMRCDAAVELPAGPPNWDQGAAALRMLGLNGVADRAESLRMGA